MKAKKLLSRVTSLMLVLAMLLSMSVVAFAAEDEPSGQEPAEVVTEQENSKTDSSEDENVPPPIDQDDKSGEDQSADDPDDSETPPEAPEITDDTQEKTEDAQDPADPEHPDAGEDTDEDVEEGETLRPFRALMAFTLSDLEGYSMEMDGARIGIEYFSLEGEDDTDSEHSCNLSFPAGTESFQGGYIADSVPATVQSEDGLDHTFVWAHVGSTRIYYMGTLTIHNDSGDEEYIYYTTDKQITNKTVYAVLKQGEKITLVYNHATYYSIDYQLVPSGNETAEAGAEVWTLDEVFGPDRGKLIAAGDGLSVSVSIPRGYTAVFTVVDSDKTELHRKELGEMMSYVGPNGGDHTIDLIQGKPDSMVLTAGWSLPKVSKDLTVMVEYQKVKEITFNARIWTKTKYASPHEGSFH